ncbi:MAG TPA: hypothetical protein VE645_18995 [Pseudonocardiaceae bacterium]|nr:hypothetical protein [Pseudonocardiaceae bacterium]
MELASYVAGEPWSDRPVCFCPVLAAFLRRYNDLTDSEGREALKPFLSRIIGTAGDGYQQARGYMATDWTVRVALPTWLEIAGAQDAAAEMRALPEITDPASARTGRVRAAVVETLKVKPADTVAIAAVDAVDAATAVDAAAAAVDAATAADAKWDDIERLDALWVERLTPGRTEVKRSAMDLLGRMVALGEDQRVVVINGQTAPS